MPMVRLSAHAWRVGGVPEKAISWPFGRTTSERSRVNHITSHDTDARYSARKIPQSSSGPCLACQTLPTLMAPSRGPEPVPRALHVALENHKGPVHVARYAKGSAKYVLTGGQDRVVRLWNPQLGTEIKAYSAHGYEVLSISV